jgi:hypothetical protein
MITSRDEQFVDPIETETMGCKGVYQACSQPQTRIDPTVADVIADSAVIKHTAKESGRHDDQGVDKRKQRPDGFKRDAEPRLGRMLKGRRRFACIGKIGHVAPTRQSIQMQPDITKKYDILTKL